jgi:3-oxoacyl-[acyl-carrier-protein] synthase-3
MKLAKTMGISAADYYLPPKVLELEELKKRKLLSSSVNELRSFGFKQIHIAQNHSETDLAAKAVSKVLKTVNPESIDGILYASALPDFRRITPNPLEYFTYPVSFLQYSFGMNRAFATGISQAGCVSFLSAIRIARDMLIADNSLERILCVGSGVLPKISKREILYNIISDGACAAIVERNASQNRIVGYFEISKGYYWETKQRETEMITTYFPTAKYTIESALKKAKLTLSDIALIVPHNVNRTSWNIMADLLKLPREKIYTRNISIKGHTILADAVINLCDAEKAGRLQKNDYVLVFTFGFGAHWACIILKH